MDSIAAFNVGAVPESILIASSKGITSLHISLLATDNPGGMDFVFHGAG
jgi:hypothetical protein